MAIFRFLVILAIFLFNASVSALPKSSISVAAVQLKTADAGNFSKIRELVKKAKMQGAELVIFPEESVFGWLNPNVFFEAAPIPGKYSDAFASIAKDENIWLAAGLGEQGPEAGSGCQANAHQAYNSGILIDPQGNIVLHHRQINVVKNAFDPDSCQKILNKDQCNYSPGTLLGITTAETPFGKTAILVCADAYIYPPAEVLQELKKLQPDLVVVFWGITASTKCECGTESFNAADYAAKAAAYLETAVVVGANAIGERHYGKFLPSAYCGTSGYAFPDGKKIESDCSNDELVLFRIE